MPAVGVVASMQISAGGAGGKGSECAGLGTWKMGVRGAYIGLGQSTRLGVVNWIHCCGVAAGAYYLKDAAKLERPVN